MISRCVMKTLLLIALVSISATNLTAQATVLIRVRAMTPLDGGGARVMLQSGQVVDLRPEDLISIEQAATSNGTGLPTERTNLPFEEVEKTFAKCRSEGFTTCERYEEAWTALTRRNMNDFESGRKIRKACFEKFYVRLDQNFGINLFDALESLTKWNTCEVDGLNA